MNGLIQQEQFEYNPNDMNNSIINNTMDSNSSLNKFSQEIQKKTKTILRRNIFGRYNNSPYLRASPYTQN